MILAYAQGGGLGHLTRLRAVLHTLARHDAQTIVTSSPFANDHRVVGDATIVAIPEALPGAHLTAWLGEVIRDVGPDEILVDVFPAGIVGELPAGAIPRDIPTVHLARLLRWDVYADRVPDSPMRFDTTYVLEDLHPDHDRFLRAHSSSVDWLEVRDPPPSVALDPPARGDAELWLLAHAGSPEEIDELLAYAGDQARAEECDPHLVVAAPPDTAASVGDAHLVDLYPVWPWFEHADRVFTAAGWNAMRQLRSHPRHHFVPFPRRFDDQFERARRRRAAPR